MVNHYDDHSPWFSFLFPPFIIGFTWCRCTLVNAGSVNKTKTGRGFVAVGLRWLTCKLGRVKTRSLLSQGMHRCVTTERKNRRMNDDHTIWSLGPFIQSRGFYWTDVFMERIAFQAWNVDLSGLPGHRWDKPVVVFQGSCHLPPPSWLPPPSPLLTKGSSGPLRIQT